MKNKQRKKDGLVDREMYGWRKRKRKNKGNGKPRRNKQTRKVRINGKKGNCN
jgi:hypothetical protein